MPRKRTQPAARKSGIKENVHIEGAGTVVEEAITRTLETNYMPYAMSVILSRAIPEIDGFKPSHRKLLYTMFNSGLLTGPRSKSANIVGRTMQLNPHGDGAIYETMIRLARGNETLLHPFVDSKGNFGKAYSKNMMYAASRYTEAKLDPICAELFGDINKDTVDFVDNYDGTMKEPTLLPVTFPTILVNANTGIAVGMASSICSFNLEEVCNTTIALMKDPDHVIADTLLAPDFIGGGSILYNRGELEKIYKTGRGGVRVRAKYTYDKESHCIDIHQIPPTTTVEAIIDKIIELVKANKIREISDIRDETGLDGLKVTIDLKRGVDPDKLMKRLYNMTPLEDSFSCNFNILVNGKPKVYGVRELLEEWVEFRCGCIRRRTLFDLDKKQKQLHLLQGLSKILLDIDKAVKIVRETAEEAEVVPNLMIGFGIDEIQAEYVAEIKLRHLNKEYILRRLTDIETLVNEIAELDGILKSKAKIKGIIVKDLQTVVKKYGKPRVSDILYVEELPPEEEEEVPDYAVNLFFTKEGYFKKITPQSLRMSSEQKLKEGDEVVQTMEAGNNTDLLFFTDRCQVYKSKASEFDDTKASVLGVYVPSKLQMEEGESARYMVATTDYSGYMLFFFENGKMAKVDLSAYATKTNRKKLMNAYSGKAPLAAMLYVKEDTELLLTSTAGRMLLLNTGAVAPKATKDTIGVAVMTLKKNHRLERVRLYTEGEFEKPARYRTKNLPAAGALPLAEDVAEQLTL